MKRNVALLISILLGIAVFIGCSDSGSGGLTSNTKADINGRVIDYTGKGVANVQIHIDDVQSETQTNTQGYFSLSVAPGAHTLVAMQDGEKLCERCFAAAEGVAYDLGDLYPEMESNCNLPQNCTNDQDCDGIFNEDEIRGWQVSIILADGSTEIRTVSSEPGEYDSDKDGLNDGEEYASRTDPRRRDTDGDMLSDYAELKVYKSNPLMLDTDGDSCGSKADECIPDPNLWDGNELFLSETSPTLADTDGDGMSDFEEINSGGTNPRLADLPELSLKLHGNPLIELDVDYVTGTSSKQQELVKEEQEKIDTDTVSTKMSIENTIQLHTETEAGTGTWPPSFNAKLTTDTKFHHGYFHDTSSSWKNASVQESQTNYETWENDQVSFDDGKLGIAMKVANQSNLSFKVKDLRVIAYRLEGGGNFTLIGTMLPDENDWPEDGHILGPGGEFTMTVKREHIGAEMMRALVRNPMAMTFEVGAYSLFQLDEWGIQETVNFSKLGEDVIQRTGIIVIDYGDGNIERYMVATNVFRNPDGSSRGVSLKKALDDIIGLNYETVMAQDINGTPTKEVLSRIKNTTAWQDANDYKKRGFWLLGGTGSNFEEGAEVDFSKIMLHNGNRINLVYIEDRDADGIYNREEYLLGTDCDDADSDGDELSDYEESKIGWEVAVSGRAPYKVFSDPRFVDPDSDFLSDRSEFYLGTDPFLDNTDGDSLADAYDSDPLHPPCLDATFLGMTAWWDGSGAPTVAQDVMEGEPFEAVASDGNMIGAFRTFDRFGNGDGAFAFNELPTSTDQHIDVPSDDSISLSRDLSISAWIYWYGPGSGATQATLLTKGNPATPNYAIFIKDDGSLVFRLRRSVYEKCWFSWFGAWDDGSCKDDVYTGTIETTTEAGTIEPGQWSHLTVSFGGELMRVYVDGVKTSEKSTTSTWTSGLYKYRTTTRYLIENDDALLIGVDLSSLPQWPYRGALDDLMISMRMYQTDEVSQLYDLGVCSP